MTVYQTKYEFLEEATLKLFIWIFKVREHKLKSILKLYRPTTEYHMHYFKFLHMGHTSWHQSWNICPPQIIIHNTKERIQRTNPYTKETQKWLDTELVHVSVTNNTEQTLHQFLLSLHVSALFCQCQVNILALITKHYDSNSSESRYHDY